ncbi:MAG TPA: tetratricopeptide repeat protein [Thermoanaerobaculia bacterium]|nr:tetratricopeptide repeat protein [Thermoanaerobaculia bacterium]
MTKRLVSLVGSLLALFILLAAFPAAAQDWKGKGRVEGRVTDPDGKPIVGATIKLRVPNRPNDGPDVKTDSRGRWACGGIRGGDWKITIESPGYLPGDIVIPVSEVQRLNPVEYKMAPAPKGAPEQASSSGLPPEVLEAVKTGNDALAEKRWADAAAAFEKVLPSAPDNVGLLMALARAYSGAGDNEKAVEMIRKVTDKDPSNWAAWMLMANLLLDKGKLDEARAALEHVPPQAVTDPNIFINVGILFLNQKRTDEAEGYFTKAVDIAPGQFDGYYYRGLARVTLGKNAEAKEDFQKVVALAPPDSNEAKEANQLLEALKGTKK